MASIARQCRSASARSDDELPGPYAVVLMVGMLFLFGTARRGMVFSLTLASSRCCSRAPVRLGALLMGLFIIQFMGRCAARRATGSSLPSWGSSRSGALAGRLSRHHRAAPAVVYLARGRQFRAPARAAVELAIQEIGRRAEGEGLGATGRRQDLVGRRPPRVHRQRFLEIFYVLAGRRQHGDDGTPGTTADAGALP